MRAAEHPKLTLAQWLLLERVARGESNHQIAVSLALTPWLVRRQLASIYGVLPLDASKNKRAAAIAWYLTVGRAWREQGAQSDE